MLFNNSNFGGKTEALIRSLFNGMGSEHLPIPPPGDYYLATDTEVFLLTDSDSNLVTN
jgi:hypothetical protein